MGLNIFCVELEDEVTIVIVSITLLLELCMQLNESVYGQNIENPASLIIKRTKSFIENKYSPLLL